MSFLQNSTRHSFGLITRRRQIPSISATQILRQTLSRSTSKKCHRRIELLVDDLTHRTYATTTTTTTTTSQNLSRRSSQPQPTTSQTHKPPRMSDDLKDEIEVINSIYGDGTLTPASPNYILTLPGASSLTLRLPESYPDVPPQVLGTHSTGENAHRGAGARDLALFRDAIAIAYQPGAVCLFDAIEEYQRWTEASLEAEAAAARSTSPAEAQEAGDAGVVAENGSLVPEYLAEKPPWVLSDPFVELKSVFVARAAPVTSPEKAAGYVQHLLATDKKARTATHNMTAWRIRGPNGTSFQDCDDDGETAAGGRLLHLLQLMDLWDVMVVVTRWYGGQKLGPRRFALINSAARDAFVKVGWVEEAGKKKGGK